ncbi:fatty acid hydroxylase family protein [Leptospira ognonensis]|uniref:Fatty acid hydroxylase family protein n=1 Tax=Leptospira ognonensis TaxID=2484945 RepID=A0A4R9KAS9_9LEPT|nr:sterol desaturase family protein [Leptospira ognonensis]TGL63828.1 fatty acid hydroxylase family protein [Leptospira ognonensis]
MGTDVFTQNGDTFMQYAFGAMIALIGIEAFFSYIKNKHYYRLNALIADVSTGIIFAVAGVGILVGALYLYDLVERHFSITRLGINLFPLESPLTFSPFQINVHASIAWAVSLVLVDFIYYWFHRHAHTMQIFWACHVTHHSAEEMNFSVAFRGNAFQRIFEYLYFLPLAVIGISWPMFFFCHRILKVYQFLVHTRFVGKLGFLELFMVTPSNHRVHHGTQSKYLDKNHAGIFIIWDKLFGSFAEETEEPLYGLTKPVRTFNPITANIHVYRDIFQNMKACRTIGDALRMLYKEPGWKPEYLRTPDDVLKEPAYTEKYNPNTPFGVMVYVSLQALVLAFVGLIIWKVAKLDVTEGWPLIISGFFLIFSLVSINRIMEMKKWSRRTEVIRNMLLSGMFVGVLLYSNVQLISYFTIPLILLSILSLLWIVFRRKTFFDLSLDHD